MRDIDVAVRAFDVIGSGRGPAYSIGMALTPTSVSRASVLHGQPLPLTSPASMKLSSVTNVFASACSLGVTWPAEQRERRIAIAAAEIAQDLIVGAVFLDDIDHMLDALAERAISLSSAGSCLRTKPSLAATVSVSWRKSLRLRRGQREEPRLRQLQHVTVAGVARAVYVLVGSGMWHQRDWARHCCAR